MFLGPLAALFAEAGPEQVREVLGKAIAEVNEELESYKQVKAFDVINFQPGWEGGFTIENKMITPSMKVRRKAVLETFAELINRLLAG